MNSSFKKVLLLLTTVFTLVAFVSGVITYAWYNVFPYWNDVVINSDGNNTQTHIINRNFLKTYNQDGTFKKTPAHVNVDTSLPNAIPTPGVKYSTSLDYSLLKDDSIIDKANGNSLKNDHFWFGFSEYNVKQNHQDIYLRGEYKASVKIDDNVIPHGATKADYNNLVKVTMGKDDNNFVYGDESQRGNESSYFDASGGTHNDPSSTQPTILANTTNLHIEKGQSVTLSIEITNTNPGDNILVSFEPPKSGIATVTQDPTNKYKALVSGVNDGEDHIFIRASVNGNVLPSVSVSLRVGAGEIQKKLTSIKISNVPSPLVFKKNSTYRFRSINAYYDDNSIEEITKGISWSSSDSHLITDAGYFTGTVVGNHTITATYYEGGATFSDTINIEIINEIADTVQLYYVEDADAINKEYCGAIAFGTETYYKAVCMFSNNKFDRNPNHFIWEVSDPSVIDFDVKKGCAKGIRLGKSTITVTYNQPGVIIPEYIRPFKFDINVVNNFQQLNSSTIEEFKQNEVYLGSYISPNAYMHNGNVDSQGHLTYVNETKSKEWSKLITEYGTSQGIFKLKNTSNHYLKINWDTGDKSDMLLVNNISKGDYFKVDSNGLLLSNSINYYIGTVGTSFSSQGTYGLYENTLANKNIHLPVYLNRSVPFNSQCLTPAIVKAMPKNVHFKNNNMDIMTNDYSSFTNVPVDKVITKTIFGSDSSTNNALIHKNENVNTSISATNSNKYDRQSFAYAIGFGFYIDPVVFLKLAKAGKITNDFKLSVDFVVTLNVSNKPFTGGDIAPGVDNPTDPTSSEEVPSETPSSESSSSESSSSEPTPSVPTKPTQNENMCGDYYIDGDACAGWNNTNPSQYRNYGPAKITPEKDKFVIQNVVIKEGFLKAIIRTFESESNHNYVTQSNKWVWLEESRYHEGSNYDNNKVHYYLNGQLMSDTNNGDVLYLHHGGANGFDVKCLKALTCDIEFIQQLDEGTVNYLCKDGITTRIYDAVHINFIVKG